MRQVDCIEVAYCIQSTLSYRLALNVSILATEEKKRKIEKQEIHKKT